MNNQYAVILGNLGNTCDRFLSTGYKDTLDKTQMLEQAASIEGVGGIELVGTWDITPQTVESMQAQLSKSDANLSCKVRTSAN